MAEIYTTHQGAPAVTPSRGYQAIKAVAPSTGPIMPPPPKAGDLRRHAKAKRKANIREALREGRSRARVFARGG